MSRTKGAMNKHPAMTIFEDCIATKPPQCRVFACVQDKRLGIRQDCCFYCPQKDDCFNPCLNNPDACGLLVIPQVKGDESNDTRPDSVP